ncbi:MAG: radical SAM protein [Syntrophales bacterium]
MTYVGCPRRRLDCEHIRHYLTLNGLEWTPTPRDADYLFLVTCGFYKLHEDASIGGILQLSRYRGELIVCGCLPATNMNRIRSVFGGKTFHTKEMEVLDELFPHFPVKFKDVPDANRAFEETERLEPMGFLYRAQRKLRNEKWLQPLLQIPEHVVAFDNTCFTLRIAEGCLGSCSYCVINKAIGRLKSKAISTIQDELRSGLKGPDYRVNLAASDTGAWGLDMGETFPHLLQVILDTDARITIAYIEDIHPAWIIRYGDNLVTLAKTGRINGLVSPFQSGSERILSLMNRPSSLDTYREIMVRLKDAHPAMKTKTQVIVGFPTETEDDFAMTVHTIKACRFDEVDVFFYFETADMDSAKIQPKVPYNVVFNRLKRIVRLLPENINMHCLTSNRLLSMILRNPLSPQIWALWGKLLYNRR